MARKTTLSVKRIFLVLLGSLFMAISVNGFLIPHKLLSSGVTGISILFNYLLDIPISLMILILNIPIFIVGYKLINREFIIISFIGMISLSIFISLTDNLPIFVDDVLLATIFGGVLSGLGAGIVFTNRGSTGGMDIIAVILRKYFSINIGNTLFIINALIVLISSFFFGIKLALYTMISIYINTIVVDKVQEGLDRKKAILVITNKYDEVTYAIMNQIHRGVTLLEGKGGFTKDSKKIIFCTIAPFQLAKIREIILKNDQNAFITVLDAAEVVGKGFKNKE
ncbi:YitT family protein [Garciella nitratireducens]|uniref:Uncharacterized membrane-anchored protein YitT, contains DUF161 and DUF2179 domains n=1 Tax=Garciella nitratireducens DSM 15102 TaxID=1121911 RepID=A0A1T4PLD1_9FIRM|nr:YitT family protein [Garciella nitratireducens]SJZ92394.1 Uncharacterized membrane-anchored protein YitT, contains DUF161 and DUF2179 domains [Garciella nitratireducens DSM 15102]